MVVEYSLKLSRANIQIYVSNNGDISIDDSYENQGVKFDFEDIDMLEEAIIQSKNAGESETKEVRTC